MTYDNYRDMSDDDRFHLNMARERDGLRPLSGPKTFRRLLRLPVMITHQNYRWGGWTLRHNARRKPLRKAKRR